MKVKTRRYYFYYLLRIGAFFIKLLPIKLIYSIGRFLGRISSLLSERYRRQTLENLKIAFPSKSDKELRKIAKNAFSNVITNFLELMHISKLNINNIDLWINTYGGDALLKEKMNRLFSKGKGIIGLTAHFGNWELFGPYMKIKGYEGITIARTLYFYKYDEYIKKLRALIGTQTIDREESPKKC